MSFFFQLFLQYLKEILLIIFAIYLIFEIRRTLKFRSEVEKPLRKHSFRLNILKRRPRKSKRRCEIDRLIFAYSQLTKEEMDNQELFLESEEPDAGLIQQIVELLFKTIIPIGTFILLGLLTTNNNLLNIMTKKAESDPEAYESINKITTTFGTIFGSSYQGLLSIALFTFLVAVHNLIFSNLRKNKIKLHLDVIKKVKENEKNTEREKESN
ncbi:hypothetical protein [Paenibacillus elgii]|uniref:hypothetical protein n=1 Tax=Paenibacillus elgii TaxID=189691 RepID=UPI00203D3A19|nr:hypothetical protein [Paenibacillus elgii]MCM3271128.1 hypothetical protein [Paenibacillus elgii]